MANENGKADDWEDEDAPNLPDDWEDEDAPPSMGAAPSANEPIFDEDGFQRMIDPTLTDATLPKVPYTDPDTTPYPPLPGPWKPPVRTPLQRFGDWAEEKARAALAGPLSYVLGNFADEAAGHVGANRTIFDAIKAGPSVPIPSWEAAYTARRNDYRRAENALRDEHPLTFHGAGLAASLFAPGPAAASGPMAAAKSGALMGAIGGLGASEADLVNPTLGNLGEAALDTAKGSALGAAVGAGGQQAFQRGGEFARWAAEKAQPWLEETAATRALKAAGYIAKDLKALNKRDMSLALEKGRTLIDEPGLITPGASISTIRERLDGLVDETGEHIGTILREADGKGVKYDIEPFLRRVEDEVLGPVAGDPVVERGSNEIQRIVDGYRKRSQDMGGLTFEEASKMKTRLQKHMINWGNAWNENSPGAHSDVFAKQMQHLFLESIDDQVGDLIGAGAKADLKVAKGRYGTFIEALQKAGERDAALKGNNAIGLKEYIAGLGALGASMNTDSVSPILATGGVMLANKAATERGSSVAAVTANRMSQSEFLRDLITSNPQAMGEWGARLSQAAARGPGYLEMEDWLLAQSNPEYAEQRRRAMGAKN